jgi:hypothetical protein
MKNIITIRKINTGNKIKNINPNFGIKIHKKAKIENNNIKIELQKGIYFFFT